MDSDIFYTTPPVELSSSQPSWPSLQLSTPIVIIQDTQNLYAGWSNPQFKQINLGKACIQFGMEEEAKKLHNAGNDAFATLRIWEILLGMEENERQTEGHSFIVKEEDTRLSAVVNKRDVGSGRIQVQQQVSQGKDAYPDLIELW